MDFPFKSTIIIGKGTFEDSPELKVSIKLFTSRVRNNLFDSNWKIDQYYAEHWDYIFPMMLKSQAQQLDFNNINAGKRQTQNSFLIDIIHVNFYHLEIASFYKCNLCSIESLAWLNAPHLRILQLTYNHIKTFKGLQKSSFMLQRLYIYTLENMAADLTTFSRVDQRLQIIGLQFNEYSCIVGQDLSFLSKIMYNHYRSLDVKVGYVKRIKQLKVQKSLSRRFKNSFQLIKNPNEIHRYSTGDTRPIRKPQTQDTQYLSFNRITRKYHNYSKKLSR